jgi:hypothetical protein
MWIQTSASYLGTAGWSKYTDLAIGLFSYARRPCKPAFAVFRLSLDVSWVWMRSGRDRARILWTDLFTRLILNHAALMPPISGELLGESVGRVRTTPPGL